MDGPLILYKAWILSLVVIAVYRRFFETVGPRSAPFEAFADGRPLLAAIRGDGLEVTRAVQCLRERLADKPKPVALFGGWPWPHYVLVLDTAIVRDGASAIGKVTLARVVPRRQRQASADVLALLEGATRGVDVEVWVHAGLRHPGRGSTPDGGYLLGESLRGKPNLEALAEHPSWVHRLDAGDASVPRRHLTGQEPGSRSCSSRVNSALP